MFLMISSIFSELVSLLWLIIAQLDDDTLDKLEPDTVTPMKLSALLAFLGLFVLLVGSVLVLWLFSRYIRRNYFGKPEPFTPSPFSDFNYKHREQFGGADNFRADDDEEGLLPRREER